MVGKKILHYKVTQKLGEGGMGVVYLAEDTRLERQVAIKFLPRHIAANSDERKRFEIEAKAAAALNHPNIATIHAIEEADDELFLVMEYVEGKELKEILNPDNDFGLTSEIVIQYALQIAQGLQAAHEKGIVHRDIKSSNIMVTDKGVVKIMDFGLAKFRGSAQLTKVGTTVGTAAYMSPEQANGYDTDQQSDIWSFGVMLYEMVSGQLPFKGDYEQAVIYSILNEKPLPLTEIIPNADQQISDIIAKCLEKEKTERFSSLDEIILLLNESQRQSSSQVIVKNETKSLFTRPLFITLAAASLIIIIGAILFYKQKLAEQDEARKVLLPEIQALAEEMPGTGEGPKSWQAFHMLKSISDIIPDDPLFKRLYADVTEKVVFVSSTEGADIYAKAYAEDDANWLYVGKSPVDSFALPVGFSQLKFEKPGHQTGYDLIWNTSFIDDTMRFELLEENKAPAEMALISRSASWFDIKDAPASLHFPGLEQITMVKHGDFLMDRFEVTNKAFKSFIDAGGYRNPDYWKYPFSFNGKSIEFEEAMSLFVDKTGQAGPATWEVGDYPDGEDDYPVTGVSWFEAAAYAAFKDKDLPTIYHWDRAAFTWASPVIIPQSNLGTQQAIAANQGKGLNRFGVYNMAGNVREWCFNESSRGGKFILGGGWNDAAYGFNDAYAQSPFDRSETNGFRCIKYFEDTNKKGLQRKIELPWRDFMNEKPVSDATFSFYLKQYEYDKTPVKAKIESVEENEDWIKQTVRFDAAYGGEKMKAIVFLPKSFDPPFQPVVYFPGSGSIHRRSSDELQPGARAEFLLKSGRALIWPIYKSTYERGDDLASDYPEMTNFWKEHVIMWVKDFSRTVDYLETRVDMDTKKLVYYGASWGGAMGGIVPAVEKRIKGSILLVAGLLFQKTLPEVEPIHYLPRITTPVIMLNGKYDFFFPYETSQLPFYKLLGTPPKDKRIFVHEGGHTYPKTEQAKQVLKWLEEYFGKTEN